MPASDTVKTNDARMANAGAIVAIPCMSIPGRPTAPACRSVLNPVWGWDSTAPLAGMTPTSAPPRRPASVGRIDPDRLEVPRVARAGLEDHLQQRAGVEIEEVDR